MVYGTSRRRKTFPVKFTFGGESLQNVSILVFRDRRSYVDGEHRFEKGYTSGKNPRKMVQLWAEKELRNYKRCGIGVGNSFTPSTRLVSARRGRGCLFFVAARESARGRGDGVDAPRGLRVSRQFATLSFDAGSTRTASERRGLCC